MKRIGIISDTPSEAAKAAEEAGATEEAPAEA